MKKVYLVSLALFISGALPGCYNRQLARAAEDLEESGYDKPRSFEYKLLGQRTAEGELEVVVVEEGRLDFPPPECTSITLSGGREIQGGEKHWHCLSTIEGEGPESSRNTWPYGESIYSIYIDPDTGEPDQVVLELRKYAGKPPEKGSISTLLWCDHLLEFEGAPARGGDTICRDESRQSTFESVKLEVTEVDP